MAYEKGAQTLVHVVQNLSSARSLDEITKFVRTAAREIAQSDGASFVLNDNGYCFYADEDAISPLWKGQRFPLNRCVSGWAMINKQAVVIEDIYQDPRVPIDAYRPTFVKSLAMTPIRLQSPIGAIGTYWKEVHRPTAQQLEMLQALADTVSVAIENVNLYQDLQERIEDLKRASQAKNEFLTTLSHELRTPLNSILGWSDMLVEGDWDDPELIGGLQAIHRNAHAQTHLIDELLDVTQMVSGQFQILSRPVDLNEAIEAAVKAAEPVAQKKNISLQWRRLDHKAMVLGDFNRLKQMMDNLISNAIKFSPNDTKVEILLGRSGPHYKVEVKDQGMGMDASFLPHTFEIFKQADGTLTRKFGGLGLGLAIVRNLAEAHRGHIEAFSAGENKGSTFSLSIPSLEG